MCSRSTATPARSAAAVGIVNAITGYQGEGHTCGIHTSRDAHVDALAYGTRTARVLVNQNLNEGAGSARNGLPFTLSLSCGTWGGNITTENVNARHFVNLTWVSRPIAARPIDEDELFAGHWERHGRCSRPRQRTGPSVRSADSVAHARVASCRLKRASDSVRSCPEISRMRCSRYFSVLRCTASAVAVAS